MFLYNELEPNIFPTKIRHFFFVFGFFCVLTNWQVISKSKTISNIALNSFSGLGSSRRHLQSGNSLSGSLHYGINSDDDILPIPQPPLPPQSVPPHLNHLIINCTEDDIDQDLDDEEEEEEEIDLESEKMSHMHHHQHHAVL